MATSGGKLLTAGSLNFTAAFFSGGKAFFLKKEANNPGTGDWPLG